MTAIFLCKNVHAVIVHIDICIHVYIYIYIYIYIYRNTGVGARVGAGVGDCNNFVNKNVSVTADKDMSVWSDW